VQNYAELFYLPSLGDMAAQFTQSIQITQLGPTGDPNALTINGAGSAVAFEASSTNVEATVDTIELTSNLGTLSLSSEGASLGAGLSSASLTSTNAQVSSNGAVLALSANSAGVSLAAGSLAVNNSGAVSITAAVNQNIALNVSGTGQITGIPAAEGIVNETVNLPIKDLSTVGVSGVVAPAAGLLGVSAKGAVTGIVPGNIVWGGANLADASKSLMVSNRNSSGRSYLISQNPDTGVTESINELNNISGTIIPINNIVSVEQILDTSASPAASRVFALDAVPNGSFQIVIIDRQSSNTQRQIASTTGVTFTEAMQVIAVNNSGITLFVTAKYQQTNDDVALIPVSLGVAGDEWTQQSFLTLTGVRRVYSITELVISATSFLVMSVQTSSGAYQVRVYSVGTGFIEGSITVAGAASVAVANNRIYAVSGTTYYTALVAQVDSDYEITNSVSSALAGVSNVTSLIVNTGGTNAIITAITSQGASIVLSSTLNEASISSSGTPVPVNSPLTSFSISSPVAYSLNFTNNSTFYVVVNTSVGIGLSYTYSNNSNTLALTRTNTFINSDPALGFNYTPTPQSAFNVSVIRGGAIAVFNATASWPGLLGETLVMSYNAGATPPLSLRLSADVGLYMVSPATATVSTQINGIIA
jgi:hypothetical protein